MHAIIERAQHIERVAPYHQHKEEQGTARLLHAENFLEDTADLTSRKIRQWMEVRIDLNDTASHPLVHIFLRPSEKDKLSDATAIAVCKDYMQRTGYGDLPWVVYGHYDTHHFHMHIVCPNITPDGKPKKITLNMLRYSRQVTHELEKKYGLDQSPAKVLTPPKDLRDLPRIEYGKQSVLPVMRVILETILPLYRYTTIGELNAVLRRYNVKASRGLEKSRTYRNEGLIYYALSDDGKEQGIYYKASMIQRKATLQHLRQRFRENEVLRASDMIRVTGAIDWAYYQKSPDLAGLVQTLQKERISVVFGKDRQDVWYVDQLTRAVFDGKTLGQEYTAPAIERRCIEGEAKRLRLVQEEKQHLQQRHRLMPGGL